MIAIAATASAYTRGSPVPRHVSPDTTLLGLYEISKILSSMTRLDQALGSVVNVLTSFLDMRLGLAVILDPDGEPEIVASAGWASPGKGRPIETLPQEVIDQIVATATPVIIEDVSADPLFKKAASLIASRLEGRVSFIGVPIKADDRVKAARILGVTPRQIGHALRKY